MKLLSPPELERLCSLVYLDQLLTYTLGSTLGKSANDMIRTVKHEKPSGLVSETDFFTVLRDIIADEKLSILRFIDYYDVPLEYNKTDKTPGNRIVVFADPDNNGIIVFRGTHGDAEWADNGARMYMTETRELLDCAGFVNESALRHGLKEIVTAGHSGGGNKSMYCFLTCKHDGRYTVNECFSLDGQGFSAEFLNKYHSDVAERGFEIVGYAERRDFVNCLGFYTAEKPLYFTGKRGNTVLPGYPFGAPLPWFHLPDSLRNIDGSIIDQAEISYISNAINALVTFVLTSPDYADKKRFLCDTLVTLMMTDTKTNKLKQADAIAVMVCAALEIASNNSGFTEMIKDVIRNEFRVILATSILLFGDVATWGESELLSLVKKAVKKHSKENFKDCKESCCDEICSALYEHSTQYEQSNHFKLFRQ
jgi:hypothetical protein